MSQITHAPATPLPIVPLFALSLLLSAGLMFMVQPMVGRLILPLLGGGPMIWATALVFFQTALLFGYLYAHLLHFLPARLQALGHLALLAAAAVTLPLEIPKDVTPSSEQPALWLLGFLTLKVGLPFVALAAQAPLLQRWLLIAAPGVNPYPLYAASNAGSLLGLLCYPFLIEPLFDLGAQAQGWRLGFFVLLVLLTACALLTSLRESPVAQTTLQGRSAVPAKPNKRQYMLWLVLAALPSGLLVAITSHLTTDMVALPLMWVPPLALYLLTFIIAFAAKPIISARMAQFIAPFALMLLCLSVYNSEFGGIVVGATIILFLFFCIVLASHTALVARQPDPRYLTHFYLTLAAGGALGGGVTALLPPLIFEWKAELPLLIMATAGLLAALNHGKSLSTSPIMGFLYGTRHRLLGDLLIPVVCGVLSFYYLHLETPMEAVGRYATLIPILSLLVVLTYFSRTNALRFALCIGANLLTFGVWAELKDDRRIFQERNFFGRFYVIDYNSYDARLMVHGTTVHGAQTLSLARRKIPLTYYAAGSGVADALLSASPSASVGIVGLGTGALACYKKPGQNWSIFEIDPAMVKLATRSPYFDYVPRCASDARIVLGDARLTLTREPDARYDYLVIDAFSSDAIPLHMITAEAFALYRAKLKPGGILLVHISNRVLNLEPVLARVAEVQGWHARILDYDSGESKPGRYVTSSIWVAMAAPGVTSVPFDPTAGDRGWALLPKTDDFRLWTDSYANVLAVVRRQNFKL